jgi:hypothetical protein
MPCCAAVRCSNRGGKSRDLLIQLSMQVSENVRVWHPPLDQALCVGLKGEKMPICFAYGCSHKSGIHICKFYRFPSAVHRKSRWVKLCR